MKVEPLYPCYKQIFPLLATALNGLQAKRLHTHSREQQDLQEKKGKSLMKATLVGESNCIITHGIHLTTMYD